MVTQGEQEAGPGRRGTPRPKSTIKFPYYDLADTMQVAGAIYEAGDLLSLDQLARRLDHKTTDSGAFRLRLAAGSMFGLLEPEAGAVRISARAKAIMSMQPEDTQQAQAEAFLAVPLFRAVYEQYQGRELPADVGLKNVLRDLGVVPKQVDRALSVLWRSAETAGFRSSGERYLVAPSAPARRRSLPEDEGQPKESSRAEQSQSGGAGPPQGVHPALMGLLQLLPPATAPWRRARKQEWITAFTAAVDAIYPTEDQAEGTNNDLTH